MTIKEGQIISFTTWAKVTKASSDSVECADIDNNNAFRIRGTDLISKALSADNFQQEKKVTKTEAAEILTSSYGKPFTVVFEKSDGESRVLRGRLVKPEPLLGRSKVEDLDVTESHKLRQVDHRTISELIVDGVKYIVK